jgi:biopolymer transport protein TolR
MGMGSSGGGKISGRKYVPMAEINVTPFIDVMLVLLIVFMVTAPLLNAGVQVDLPKSDAAAINDDDSKPIEVSFNKAGEIFVGESKVSRNELLSKLGALSENDVEKRIFIRADQNLPYGDVMGVIGLINKAGYRKVALISDPSNRSQ